MKYSTNYKDHHRVLHLQKHEIAQLKQGKNYQPSNILYYNILLYNIILYNILYTYITVDIIVETSLYLIPIRNLTTNSRKDTIYSINFGLLHIPLLDLKSRFTF